MFVASVLCFVCVCSCKICLFFGFWVCVENLYLVGIDTTFRFFE